MDANVESDHRKGKIPRLVIDDLTNLPEALGKDTPESSSVERKDAARTGNLLIIDGDQVWDTPKSIEYVMMLAEIKPWFTEEPDEYVLYLPLPFAPCYFFHSVHHINDTLSAAPLVTPASGVNSNPSASVLPLANTHIIAWYLSGSSRRA